MEMNNNIYPVEGSYLRYDAEKGTFIICPPASITIGGSADSGVEVEQNWVAFAAGLIKTPMDKVSDKLLPGVTVFGVTGVQKKCTVKITSRGYENLAYVIYNGTKYVNVGDTFEVNGGDEITVYGNAGMTNTISVDGNVVERGGAVECKYVVDADIDVDFNMSPGAGAKIEIVSK